MTYQIINLKRGVSLLFITLFFGISYSQEAEKIYHEEYSKLSFVLQPSILDKNGAGNNDRSTYPRMEFIEDFSYQFGVYYNFAQSGKFNFKTGVIAKEFVPKFNLNITNEDIGYNVDYDLTGMDPYNQFIITIPFKTDFFLKLSNKLGLSLGAGLNLNFITGPGGATSFRVSVNDNAGNEKDIFKSYSSYNNKINLCNELSIGLNYKTKFAFFDLSYYSNRITGPNYTSGNYQIMNLVQSPDKKGGFYIDSFFHGLSLAISPKKGWLR